MISTTRLSEDRLKQHLDGGSRVLPGAFAPSSGDSANGLLSGIDFEGILAQENHQDMIASLPIQPLLAGIKARGLSESLAILNLISQDQLTRLLDYDGWQEDRLHPGRFLAWFMAYYALGQEVAAERFIDLEEEYQLALLSGKIQVLDREQWESLPDEDQDQFFEMPCRTVFYRIQSGQEVEIQAIANLIEGIKAANLSYAYSLLTHSAFAPPAENEALLAQFRQARLEEDGFVSYEESLKCFHPLSPDELRHWHGQIEPCQRPHSELAQVNSQKWVPFYDRLMDYLDSKSWDLDRQYQWQQGLLYVANSLSTACQVSPGDVEGQRLVLNQLRALWGLGIEYFSRGDLELAVEQMANIPVVVCFRAAMTLVHDLRREVAQRLKSLPLPKVEEFDQAQRAGKWGLALRLIDTAFLPVLGLEYGEVLKGLYNRLPMCPLLISEEAGLKKINFIPLSSLQVFRDLCAYSEAMVAMTQIGQTQLPASLDFEKGITRFLLGGLVGQPLGSALNEVQAIPEFSAMTQEQVAEAMKGLSDKLIDFLGGAEAQWRLALDGAEKAASLNIMIHLLSDRMLNLVLAKQHSPQSLWAQIGVLSKGPNSNLPKDT